MEPLLLENEHGNWEKITLPLITWARSTARYHERNADPGALFIPCLNCRKPLNIGDGAYVTYSKVRKETFRNVFCTILCQRQSRMMRHAKEKRKTT